MIKKVILAIIKFIQIKIYSYNNYLVWKHKVAIIKSIWLSYTFLEPAKRCIFMGKVYLNDPHRINLGSNNIFGDNLYLTAWSKFSKNPSPALITIGNNCNFGACNHITATNSIVIGDNCLTGKWVTVSDNNHGRTSLEDLKLAPMEREVVSKGPVVIGKNVWVGGKLSRLGGDVFGEGAVIAANSVVTKDVPAYCVVAGNPANIIKKINI